MLQYVDRNVGPADYKHLKPDEVLVTKVFLTLQCEGPFAGTPAVFIRLAGCDKGDKISCTWCDTDFQFANGKVFTVAELLIQVELKFVSTFHMRLSANPPLVVITGGEPMIQDNLSILVEALYNAHFSVQIESNGDRLAKGFDHPEAKLVVSPKVNPSSKKYRRLKEAVFKRADYLKFVVEADPASPYHDLPPFIFEWVMYKNDASRVFISPVTAYSRAVEPGEIASLWTDDLINEQETARNYAYAAELCLKYGYRFSCQVHTFLGVE